MTVTYRLAGALPSEVLTRWDEELALVAPTVHDQERRRRIEAYLDAGHGEPLLARPELAELVEEGFLFNDSRRYRLHAWVVMPNHVHVLFTPTEASLTQSLQTWKSYSAHRALELLGREGPFWQPDYFDRAIRNEEHYRKAVEYIEMNPVKAGLVSSPEQWRYGSARYRSK